MLGVLQQPKRPSHGIMQAINYTLPRWEKLILFAKDGNLLPDNNPIERSIRPIAIGRKNYLFAGSQQGAVRLAKIYSLLGTCRMHDVDPYAWLKDVIQRLSDYPINRIHELLPQNWKSLAH